MKRRCPSAKTTSKASEDLPEPLGPVTTVSAPCGMVHETLFRLCSRAFSTWMASTGAALGTLAYATGSVSTGLACSPSALPGLRARPDDRLRRPLGDDPPAVRAAAGAEVDDPVGRRDHVEIVLDDEHARPLLHERVQGSRRGGRPRRGAPRSARRATKRRAPRRLRERARELEALRLAARERRQGLPEREVPEPDARDRRERVHDRGLVVGAPSDGASPNRAIDLVDGQAEHLGDVEPPVLDREHLGPEALALADGAEERDVREELHLDRLVALARARLAAPGAGTPAPPTLRLGDVEGEVAPA